MGYTFDDLIPAAILLDNPGITKEEFSRRLMETDSGGFGASDYHSELIGLAHVLRLPPLLPKEAFYESYDSLHLDAKRKFNYWRHSVEKGTPSGYPQDFSIHEDPLKNKWSYVHRTHTVHPERVVKFENTTYNGRGEFLSDGGTGQNKTIDGMNGIILRILKSEGKHEDENSEHSYSYRRQKLHVLPFEMHRLWFVYDSLAELVEKHPSVSPEKVWDFSQTHGKFNIHEMSLRESAFYWRMKDGKYYLDEKTFDEIPLHWDWRRNWLLGYTDLKLTASAVRTKFWKVLGNYGRDVKRLMFAAHPETEKEYEKAVWDGETSLLAKRAGWTHNELMRFRLGVLPLERLKGIPKLPEPKPDPNAGIPYRELTLQELEKVSNGTFGQPDPPQMPPEEMPF